MGLPLLVGGPMCWVREALVGVQGAASRSFASLARRVLTLQVEAALMASLLAALMTR